MLVTLEVGHAVIDLRLEAQGTAWLGEADRRWPACLEQVLNDISLLFQHPDAALLDRALVAVSAATWIAQEALPMAQHDRERRHDVQRILSHLHFIRSALIDRDTPLGTLQRLGDRVRSLRAISR
jgi:hypothetical protein